MPIKMDGPDERPEKFRVMKKAYYGSAQEVYNVKHNQVWYAGDHRFICGDLIEVASHGLLKNHIPEINVIYTDPPWTPSIYKQFYNNADQKAKLSYEDFLHETIAIIRWLNPNGIIFIESGQTSQDAIITELEDMKAHTLSIIDCTYTKRHTKYILWVGSFNRTVTLPEDLMKVGRHENQVVLSIAHSTARPGVRFMDPLCGQMSFIIPAAMKGATVYGVELIPRKFAEGLRAISRVIGQPKKLVTGLLTEHIE